MLSELKEYGTASGRSNQASCYVRGRQSTKYNRMNRGRVFLLFMGCFAPWHPHALLLVAGNAIANYTIRLNNLHISTDSKASSNLGRSFQWQNIFSKEGWPKKSVSAEWITFRCSSVHLFFTPWVEAASLSIIWILALGFSLLCCSWAVLWFYPLFYIWIKLSFCASGGRFIQ